MAANGMALATELKKHFGFDTFKGNQEEVIKNLLAGNDTFVLMPTGGGKISLLPTSCPDDAGHSHNYLAVDSPDEKPG